MKPIINTTVFAIEDKSQQIRTYYAGGGKFTSEWNMAKKFESKSEADDVMVFLALSHLKVEEHVITTFHRESNN